MQPTRSTSVQAALQERTDYRHTLEQPRTQLEAAAQTAAITQQQDLTADQAEGHQQVLAQELAHRVKETMVEQVRAAAEAAEALARLALTEQLEQAALAALELPQAHFLAQQLRPNLLAAAEAADRLPLARPLMAEALAQYQRQRQPTAQPTQAEAAADISKAQQVQAEAAFYL